MGRRVSAEIGHPNRAMGLFSCFRFAKTRDKQTNPVSNNGKRRGRRRRRGNKSLSPVGSGSGNRASHPPVGRTSLTYSLDHTVSGGYASPRSALSDEDNYFDTNEEQFATPASFDSHGHAGSVDEDGDEDGLDTLVEHETLWDRLTHWISSLTAADKPNQELENDVIDGGRGHVETTTDGPERLEISTSGHLTSPNRSIFPGKVTPKYSKRVIVEDDGGDGPTGAPSGCIGFLTASQVALAHRKFLKKARPKAGGSFTRRTPDLDEASAACAYEPVEASAFQVRSLDYMRSGKKEASNSSIYRLLGVDMFTFDRKAYHIAQHVELPNPEVSTSGNVLDSHGIPPLLIINLQLPMYAPSIFGKNDGPGHSLVYYFSLPDGWTPEQVGNSAALGLLQRFVADGTEFDGQRTRDRLKLIPRIVNVEEWASVSRLSGTEVRLLKNYNGKPILTRPQQKFFLAQDKSYFEVDLDVHSFAYIARRAYYGYIDRLSPVVFENAFVLQGNRKEELPEVILGAVRVFRVDFRKARPFPSIMT